MAEHTQQQSTDDQKRSRDLSLRSTHPPTDVPGIELQKFLGSGAYGEVWVGIDRKTGRQVAVKFYTHRGGLDWTLLSREVEKLVFLSADRYVVQLLDVGWDADPPYYVMEYIENGSLDDRLKEQGPLPMADAIELFAEVATGLVHAHGKGVLHCDLKPANILLDEDQKPRLADFGQSRLSHEQSPSLGTLFYMAPEQADLEAVPDARWDVYALGAMLYCSLTGEPPYRNEYALAELDEASDLADRLQRYRHIIQSSPPPTAHRQIAGMDRAMADIIDHCIAADPKLRYPNIQGVLDALLAREQAKIRRPLVVLGFVGPLLLLAIMALFGWRGYHRAMSDSDAELTKRAQEANYFAAKAVAGKAAEDIETYFKAVESIARDPQFGELFAQAKQDDSFMTLVRELADPMRNGTPLDARGQFLEHSARDPLQERMEALMADERLPKTASWFVCGPYGTQWAAIFDDENATITVGRNYSWRTYFHGGLNDLVEEVQEGNVFRKLYRRPDDGQRIEQTQLSAPFRSTATNRWKVAVSTPVLHEGQFVGVLALTVDIGVFLRFDELTDNFFAVLVDARPGEQEGMILQHPLYDTLVARHGRLPERFSAYRIDLTRYNNGVRLHRDILGQDKEGKEEYDKLWVAAQAPVRLERGRTGDDGRPRVDTGLIVLVQENYQSVVKPVHDLGNRLLREGLWALLVVILVVFALWCIVLRVMGEPAALVSRRPATNWGSTPLYDLTTLQESRETKD